MTSAELSALLGRLIVGWENEVVEFETASKQNSADKTGEYVSAIANEANLRGLPSGSLIFGIDDQRTAVGTAHLPTSQSRQSLKHHVQQSIDQGLTIREIYEVEYQGKRVVLAEIPAAPEGIPISWKGNCRSRAGESLAPLSLDKLEQMLQPPLQMRQARAECIRTRAQDDVIYIKQIHDYLKKFGSATHSDLNGLLLPQPSDALSDAKKHTKVKNLIATMRRDHLIVNAGTRPQPRWSLDSGGKK